MLHLSNRHLSIFTLMLLYLKIYAVALVTFLAIDIVWLAAVARGFYQKHLGYLLAEQPNLYAAGVFYLLFVAGMVVFATMPALAAGSFWRALALGAFFGLVTYATYDLTNQATVKQWPWIVTAIDLTWGAFISATVSTVGYFAGRWLG
ncbi:hypothetical protein Pan181_47580 [Aeoliella mucimassa]|uniref:DUF2177 domain-containing protein n=2 Tax=Aeoliella mucimassa TaxID=2527972 RepID=A0A518AUY0_9BACT|nr:hypothetical protein Pan181_47580 [Aeoliella mucimassa]